MQRSQQLLSEQQLSLQQKKKKLICPEDLHCQNQFCTMFHSTKSGLQKDLQVMMGIIFEIKDLHDTMVKQMLSEDMNLEECSQEAISNTLHSKLHFEDINLTLSQNILSGENQKQEAQPGTSNKTQQYIDYNLALGPLDWSMESLSLGLHTQTQQQQLTKLNEENANMIQNQRNLNQQSERAVHELSPIARSDKSKESSHLSNSKYQTSNTPILKKAQSAQQSREESKHSSPYLMPQQRDNTSIQSQTNNPCNTTPQMNSNQFSSPQLVPTQIIDTKSENFQLESQIQIQTTTNQQQVNTSQQVTLNQQQEINSLSADKNINAGVKAEETFDAFGYQSMISENQKIKNMIRNNSYAPGQINRQSVKFSFLCFEFLDDMLLVSVKLEALKQHYHYVFLDFEIVDKYCNIYINTNMMGWDNILREIEEYMPFIQICPMRDIKRGFEQLLINAFIENHNKHWNEKKFRISFTSITDPRISQQVFQEGSSYTQENEPELIANQGVMVIFILKRDLTELNHVTKLINGFIMREYQNLYDLFELCDETDFAKRAHIAVYLKKTQLIDQALSRRGYQKKMVDYKIHKQRIFIRATQNEYDDFVQEVKNAICSVQTKRLSLKLRIHIMKTYLSKGLTLQQKVHNKFNVFVSEVFRVVTKMNEETDSEHQVCEYVSIPEKILINQEHQYQIQVTGVLMNEAVNYIKSILSDYSFVEQKLNYMNPTQTAQLIQKVDPIKLQYSVITCLVRGTLYMYGRKSKGQLDKFVKELKALVPKNPKKN
eukprot:403356784